MVLRELRAIKVQEAFTRDRLHRQSLTESPAVASAAAGVPAAVFCCAWRQMGTAKESFIELTERIGRKTGGVSVYPFSSAKRGSDTPVSYIMVRFGGEGRPGVTLHSSFNYKHLASPISCHCTVCAVSRV